MQIKLKSFPLTVASAVVLWGSAIGNHSLAQADDIAYGEYLSSGCLSCHSLTDTTQALPALASYNEESMIALLTVYRDGENLNPAMQNVAKSLTDDEIRALALYFAQLEK